MPKMTPAQAITAQEFIVKGKNDYVTTNLYGEKISNNVIPLSVDTINTLQKTGITMSTLLDSGVLLVIPQADKVGHFRNLSDYAIVKNMQENDAALSNTIYRIDRSELHDNHMSLPSLLEESSLLIDYDTLNDIADQYRANGMQRGA